MWNTPSIFFISLYVVTNKHHQKILRVAMARRKQKIRQVQSLPPRSPQQQPKGLTAKALNLIRFVCVLLFSSSGNSLVKRGLTRVYFQTVRSVKVMNVSEDHQLLKASSELW